jgi:hypothetical protein
MPALLLLSVIISALPCMRGFALSPADSARRLAACHSHHPATVPAAPLKTPASCQCCVEGHRAAIANAEFSPPPLTQVAAERPQHSFLAISWPPPSAVFSVTSASPPGAAPLRV